jgi:hypothetical protein
MKVSYDEDHNELVQNYITHRNLAQNQRNYYNQQKNVSIFEFNQFLQSNGNLCDYTGKAQYSFDFAQCLKFPSFSLQTGIMYFKSPRNCHVFDITCGNNNNNQFNYIIDEANVISKNPDLVISLLHDFFEKQKFFKPKKLLLQADNYVAQNKNNAVMQYFL